MVGQTPTPYPRGYTLLASAPWLGSKTSPRSPLSAGSPCPLRSASGLAFCKPQPGTMPPTDTAGSRNQSQTARLINTQHRGQREPPAPRSVVHSAAGDEQNPKSCSTRCRLPSLLPPSRRATCKKAPVEPLLQHHDPWGRTALQGRRAGGPAAVINALQQHADTRRLGSGARCTPAGMLLGEMGPGGMHPREEGWLLLLPISPPPARCRAEDKIRLPTPFCSRAVQKAAGSCREPAYLACRRESRAEALSCATARRASSGPTLPARSGELGLC